MYPWRCVVCGQAFTAHQATCTGCFETGSLLRIGQRPAAEIDAVPEVTDAHALAKAAWTIVPLSSYPGLRLGKGALVTIYGPPGSGKSSFATRALDGLRGPVVFLSSEEGPGPSLHDRLARCRVRRPDFVVVSRASVDQVVDIVRTRRAIGLVVDSVQVASFTAEDLRHVLAVLPSLAVLIAVAQVNKRGEIEGRERLLHEADVVLRCTTMRWALEKSRYQPIGLSGAVLEEKVEVSDAVD